jgi:hypothetical protein
MYLFKKIVFDCKQATLLSIKKDQGKITFGERLKLSYHLLYCDPCRQFIDQWKRLDKAGREIQGRLSLKPPFLLPPAVRKKIHDELSKDV